MAFSESIAASDLKDSRCRQLIELMKVSVYWSSSFLDLGPNHLHMKIKTGFSQKSLDHFYPNFVCKLLGTWKCKFSNMMVVT